MPSRARRSKSPPPLDARESPPSPHPQHPPRPPTGDPVPAAPKGFPQAPRLGPESPSWTPTTRTRPPRATPWFRYTKMVAREVKTIADGGHPAKGSPVRMSLTPRIPDLRISYPRRKPTAAASQAIRAGSLLHILTDQVWVVKWHKTVKVARKCWWGTFYYGGSPCHAFLLTKKGPV